MTKIILLLILSRHGVSGDMLKAPGCQAAINAAVVKPGYRYLFQTDRTTDANRKTISHIVFVCKTPSMQGGWK